MEITYKKGNRVTIKDGSSTKMATVVADGLDSQKRVRVRVDGFPMDMSITTNQSSNVYVIEKMAKGSTVKGVVENYSVGSYGTKEKAEKMKKVFENAVSTEKGESFYVKKIQNPKSKLKYDLFKTVEKFGNGGGVAVSSQSEMDSVEDTKSHFGYDNESWNELSKEEKIKMRKLAKEHLLLGAKSNESSPYWDYSIGGL